MAAPLVVLLDNYDSFTYNLYDYLLQIGVKCVVLRNDEADVAQLAALRPHAIVLSPGPGRPAQAGILNQSIAHFYTQIPILGICLGHQAIGQMFGGRVIRAQQVMHGKTSTLAHDGSGVFAGLPQDFAVTRYHSLIVEEASLPTVLAVNARTSDGTITQREQWGFPGG